MHIQYELLLLVVCALDVCTCQTDEGNGTMISRREILEKQARAAYQNACFGLQELANWMSVVFKMKSVWASSTIVQVEENSRTLKTGQRTVPPFPQRPKTTESECSLKSAQVTLQTYAHLQSQVFYLKTLMGRNFVKTSSEILGDANVSIRERIKMLDVFNETLNDIFSKLRQNTQELSPVSSENWNVRNVVQDLQGGRLPRLLQIPSNIFQVKPGKEEMETSEQPPTKPRGLFQTLGKALDRVIFPTERAATNSKPTKEKIEDENLGTLERNDTNERNETIKMGT